MADDLRPLPVPNDEDGPFWAATREHRLVLPHCQVCGNTWFPPYGICPSCLSRDRVWVEASGYGTVVGYTVFHRQYLPSFEPPFHVALVQLEEGPRMFANISGLTNDEIEVGLRVQITFEDITEEISLPQFERALPVQGVVANDFGNEAPS